MSLWKQGERMDSSAQVHGEPCQSRCGWQSNVWPHFSQCAAMFVITSCQRSTGAQENWQQGHTGGGGRKQGKQTKLMVNSGLNHPHSATCTAKGTEMHGSIPAQGFQPLEIPEFGWHPDTPQSKDGNSRWCRPVALGRSAATKHGNAAGVVENTWRECHNEHQQLPLPRAVPSDVLRLGPSPAHPWPDPLPGALFASSSATFKPPALGSNASCVLQPSPTFPGRSLWISATPHHPPPSLLSRALWAPALQIQPTSLLPLDLQSKSRLCSLPCPSPMHTVEQAVTAFPISLSLLHTLLLSSFPPPLRVLMLDEVSH